MCVPTAITYIHACTTQGHWEGHSAPPVHDLDGHPLSQVSIGDLQLTGHWDNALKVNERVNRQVKGAVWVGVGPKWALIIRQWEIDQSNNKRDWDQAINPCTLVNWIQKRGTSCKPFHIPSRFPCPPGEKQSLIERGFISSSFPNWQARLRWDFTQNQWSTKSVRSQSLLQLQSIYWLQMPSFSPLGISKYSENHWRRHGWHLPADIGWLACVRACVREQSRLMRIRPLVTSSGRVVSMSFDCQFPPGTSKYLAKNQHVSTKRGRK